MRPEQPNHYAGQRMLPEELGDTTFFHLGDNKREQAIAEWFRRIGKK
jgi:replication-associated recombination protein RarA